MIKVSVIIPTYHDWERLKICIDALSKQTYSHEKYEVIIVNNDPEDTSSELSLPENFRIISEGKLGSYAARNAGIRVAQGEILAFTDSDCIPDKDWLLSGKKCLQDSNKETIVGGGIRQFNPNNIASEAVFQYQKIFSFNQKNNINNGFSVTANFFIYTDALKDIGYFNDSLLSGGDREFCERALNELFQIRFCERAIVNHPVRLYLRDLIQKKRRTKGGAYARSSESPRIKHIFILFIYPLLILSDSLNANGVTNKFKVLLISWLLYAVQLGEGVRLWIFDSQMLRK